METKGYIYKITNKINKKIYVGQTKKYPQTRWNEHKRNSANPLHRNYEYPLYKAFRKYGIENFSFEIIEECEFINLDSKEIFWINFYDSYNNGYNQSLGGKGFSKLNLDETKIIEEYKKEQNISLIAQKYNCSNDSIRNILLKHNIPIKSASDIKKESGFEIFQYDENFKLIQTFPSLQEASRWLKENQNIYTKQSLASTLRKSIIRKIKAYGFYWDSNEYQEIKKESQKETLINIQKKYNSKKIKTNSCLICNTLIDSQSKYCSKCSSLLKKEKSIKEKESKGITRDFLKKEIRNKSFIQIAKEQKVSDNAIRKWCKLFNLPSKSSEIKNYTDEEWDKI